MRGRNSRHAACRTVKAHGRPAGLQVVQKGPGVRGVKEGAGGTSLLPQAIGAKQSHSPHHITRDQLRLGCWVAPSVRGGEGGQRQCGPRGREHFKNRKICTLHKLSPKLGFPENTE